jgi:hypothetical protein
MSSSLSGLAHYFNSVGNDREPLPIAGGFGYISGGTGSVFSDDSYVRGFSNPFGGPFAQKYYGGFGSLQSTMMSGKAYAFDALKCYNDFRMTGIAGVQAPPQISILPPVEGAAGGAARANPAGGGSDVNMNADDDSEENTIPEQVRKDAVTKLVEMGYSESEAEEIVSRITTAAENDRTKFNSILGKVPPKMETLTNSETGEEITRENADWAEEFGEWYSQYIKGMSGKAAEDYVHEIAFDAFVRPDSNTGPYVKAAKGETVKIDINGDGQLEDARVYTVTEDSGTDVQVGTEIYRVGSNSNSRWYVKRGDSYEEIPFRVKGNGNTIQLFVGRVDSLAVTPAGTETDINGNVYEEYTVQAGSAEGETSNSYAGNGTLYFRDGKWYYSNGNDVDAEGVSHPKFQPLENQPASFENGRLTFGKEPQYVAREGFDARLDAQDYMRLLDEGVDAASARAAEIEQTENEQTTQTVEEVASQLRDLFGEAGLEVTVSEDGKKIELKAAPESAGAIAGTIEEEDNKDKLNALLDSLPAGTRVALNGSPLVGSTNRADRIAAELNKIDSTRSLWITDTIDLRNEDSIDGVKEELRKIIRQQQISNGTMNPSAINFSAVQLPADVVPDSETLKTLLEEVAKEEGITYNGQGSIDGYFLIYEDGKTEPAKVISASFLPADSDMTELETTMRQDIYGYNLPGVTAGTNVEFIWWGNDESTSTSAAPATEESSPPISTSATPSSGSNHRNVTISIPNTIEVPDNYDAVYVKAIANFIQAKMDSSDESVYVDVTCANFGVNADEIDKLNQLRTFILAELRGRGLHITGLYFEGSQNPASA